MHPLLYPPEVALPPLQTPVAANAPSDVRSPRSKRYIYIYIKRERESEREQKEEGERVKDYFFERKKEAMKEKKKLKGQGG